MNQAMWDELKQEWEARFRLMHQEVRCMALMDLCDRMDDEKVNIDFFGRSIAFQPPLSILDSVPPVFSCLGIPVALKHDFFASPWFEVPYRDFQGDYDVWSADRDCQDWLVMQVLLHLLKESHESAGVG